MTQYRYKVVPAPTKGRKTPGVKAPEARFARSLEEVMNDMAAQGWEYLRADILPSEERQGLTSTATVYRSVLVFRRDAAEAGPELRGAPPLTARRSPDPASVAAAPPVKKGIAPDSAEADYPPVAAENDEPLPGDRADDATPAAPPENAPPEDAPGNGPQDDPKDAPDTPRG